MTLIENDERAKEAERQRFFEIAERFQDVSRPADAQQAKEELACMIFGGKIPKDRRNDLPPALQDIS